ncbi:hypothetical protein L1049_023997 [Liquidambar formosana]|uniref:Pentatricopeptide repeat-containing protein n=1 Tax=Liquidambar formosana TaxID=63359 RepID=A0AAP0RU67_LIQFO
MARISIREFLRFRSTFLTHPTITPSKSNNPFSQLSSSSFSTYSEDRTISSHHPSVTQLLQTCQNMRQLFQIQAHFISCGLFHNPFLASRVLKQSADFGDFDYTILIFRCIDSPDTFCVNTVIKGYSSSSVPHQAVVFYFQMLRNGFLPNSFTFPPLFSSCVESGCCKSGQKCHGQAIKNGVDGVLPVQNSLIHMYGCFKLIDISRQMFDGMSDRDVVSWNSIVDGYVKFGDLGIAHKMFDVMPDRNVVSWNIMIGGYLKVGNPGCGLKLFREMMKTGLRGSDTTMVCAITACGRSARLREGRSIHGSLIKTFLKSSLILDTALIDMYSKCRRVDVACKVFDRIPKRNLVCWNAMILGHCIHGNPEDGLNLFAKMLEGEETELCKRIRPDEGQGVPPDEITFIGVLCACARAGLLTEGRNYFRQMIDVFSLKPNFAHYWCMANLLARVGMVQEAEEALRNMAEDTEEISSESSVWAGLLGICRFQGDVTLGERMGYSLIELEPQNLLCYALLLNVYAVAGRWEDVARVKEMLKERVVGRIPGCSLVELKEIVHKFKVGDKRRHGMEEVNSIISELAQRLSLPITTLQYPSLSKTETGS